MKLYQRIAQMLQAIQNCKESGNTEWQEKHEEVLYKLVRDYMPSGSGIDSGCIIYPNKSISDKKIVFSFDYHHMKDGFYTHWSTHLLTIIPSFVNDFEMKITGLTKRDYNLDDYLYQTFDYALRLEI